MSAKSPLIVGGDVRIFFSEPQVTLRHALRSAMHRDGFETIQEFEELEAIISGMQAKDPDLLILDSGIQSDVGDTVQLAHEIRAGKIGKNPFVPIILTMWQPTEQTVRRVSKSGADDLLMKPLSPAQLLERISALTKHRKPFIVTNDYIGPDRRKPTQRSIYVPTIDVPNTLRAKILGEELDDDTLYTLVKEVQATINMYKIKRNAVYIATLVRITVPFIHTGKVMREINENLDKLLASVVDTAQRAQKTQYESVGSVCKSLFQIVKTLKTQLKSPSDHDMKMLQPISDAILASVFTEKENEAVQDEIKQELLLFTKRMETLLSQRADA